MKQTDIMDFFGLEVKPGKAVSYVVESGKTLRITQVLLNQFGISVDFSLLLLYTLGFPWREHSDRHP